MTAEHVVATRVHSRQGHPKTAPDGDGSLQFGPHVAVDLEEERERLSAAMLPANERTDGGPNPPAPPFLSTAGAVRARKAR